jgi:hypothetical protein
MNRLILTAVLVLVSLPAFAKNKVYDLTGTVSFSSFNSNAEAHVDLGNGETADAYCNVDEHSVDCRSHGGVFYLTLADGKRYTFFLIVGFPSQCCGDPVGEAEHARQMGKGDGSFKYSLNHYHALGAKQDAICVPYINDKGKEQEACYDITQAK